MNDLTRRIIGCAIEVHRHLGPGLLETVYESALCIELTAQGLAYVRQVCVPAYYKGQLLTYLKATDKRVGLLINFNSRLLKDGITRLIL